MIEGERFPIAFHVVRARPFQWILWTLPFPAILTAAVGFGFDSALGPVALMVAFLSPGFAVLRNRRIAGGEIVLDAAGVAFGNGIRTKRLASKKLSAAYRTGSHSLFLREINGRETTVDFFPPASMPAPSIASSRISISVWGNAPSKFRFVR